MSGDLRRTSASVIAKVRRGQETCAERRERGTPLFNAPELR